MEAELSSAEKIRLFRERVATDFAFFAENFVKIAPKNGVGGEIPFRLNKVQRDLLKEIDRQWAERGMVRIVVLKARQQGFSTFVQAYAYWWAKHRRVKNCLVVANDMETTKSLFQKLRFTHKMMPDRLRPNLEKASERSIRFADLDTSISVSTAGSDALGRGQTYHMAWMSELAFWPEKYAEDNLQAALVACPSVPGSIVIVESTAKGVSGAYYDLYNRCPDNGFVQFFSPWFDSAEYRLDPPEGFGENGTLTPEELELIDTYGLDLAQIYWRRREIARAKNKAKFLQEYPACPDDAFQNSGAPVFSSIALAQQAETAEPVNKMMMWSDEENDFVETDDAYAGDLKLFYPIKEGETYSIGVDVGLGLSKDRSVACVLDANKRQVGIYRTNTVIPRQFARHVYRLGMMFNSAEIIVENMHAGHTVADRLAHDYAYPNLWRNIVDTKVTEVTTEVVGFTTNRKSKVMIIDRLRDDLECGRITINCPTTLTEMREFIKRVKEGESEEKAALTAPPGKHDDCVMALALVNYITDAPWIPVSSELIEQSYFVGY